MPASLRSSVRVSALLRLSVGAVVVCVMAQEGCGEWDLIHTNTMRHHASVMSTIATFMSTHLVRLRPMVVTITVWLKFGEREKEHRGSYRLSASPRTRTPACGVLKEAAAAV